ncbi:MAG: FliI/YscN family ATPase [Methyloligellaceae bacterium]
MTTVPNLQVEPTLQLRLENLIPQIPLIRAKQHFGILKESRGPVVRITLENARIGDICNLVDPDSGHIIPAEIVAVHEKDALLSPYGPAQGFSAKTRVIATGQPLQIPVGENLKGKILNAYGQALYGEPLNPNEYEHRSARAESPNPVERPLIDTVFSTGIRAIDSLITMGEGQRIGIFGEPGAGKSVLLSMIAQHAKADVCVLALIGERGREVREFLDRQLPPELRKNCVTVVSTSDRPSMERVIGAYTATTIAEYFRDQGKSVLLLMDSVTRYARALREVGLAAGEAPARKGFPASVLSEMPLLIERSGLTEKGSITAIYTVLLDADTLGDPVAEELRSLTDGHIILSYKTAQSGHYPAIDVLASKSRIMDEVVTKEQKNNANRIRELLSKYKEIELLVQVGEYQRGSDTEADTAIDKYPEINTFLRQQTDEHPAYEETISKMEKLLT